MLHAVDDVSFSVQNGETLGLVGESGCGKSTLGRTMIRLLDATSGSVFYNGVNIMGLSRREMKQMRKKIQIVFQDPYSSLNPRMSVNELIAEPLVVNSVYSNSSDMRKRVLELMDTVGLARRLERTYPHELDGGRRQRIGIARALALNPEFIVLDEPVSALDVCIQAQILNLLKGLQRDFGYTYVFISHNLSVVNYVSTHIAVMYLGKIVEMASGREIFKKPAHPYTKALISAIPLPVVDAKSDRIILEGDVPSPVNPPTGCRFAGRCRFSVDRCSHESPEPVNFGSENHFVACFNASSQD
ncbi:MAG: ATP-binding cassette domain-containing protein [Synergistaceae bacterium]|nr:ATP-binding cassette domain-containing protein [Synergistaceae bacterium]